MPEKRLQDQREEEGVADQSSGQVSHLRGRLSSLGFLGDNLHRLGRISNSSRTGSHVRPESKDKGPLGLNILHDPSEPRVDFIFVHGLNGGSTKTWSYSSEEGMFWPKFWLPNESGFKNVRLHSFGYDANWNTRKDSHLTVHDFGQALLTDLFNSPHLKRNAETPLVIVAHSMGGLVAKKESRVYLNSSYILATRDPTYSAIAQRFHAIYFLATPHRGADSANFAKLVLRSTGSGAKAFLDDLIPGCGTLDQINDEFRHVCGNLQLWSFYETIPTTMKLMTSLIVEKASAILWMPKEHVQHLDANHRNICKFDTPSNPNYLALRHAFLTTIQEVETNGTIQQRDERRAQLKRVASYFGIEGRPDAIRLAILQKQQTGSCRWLTDAQIFQRWLTSPVIDAGSDQWNRDTSNESTPGILWLKGRPGTGKSVSCSHIVNYLHSCNIDCSYYFFRHEDKPGATISALLRSLAFQMADSNFEIRKKITTMIEQGIRINLDNYHVLWNSVFLEQIFKAQHPKSHIWVIDAIDECSNMELPALISMISHLRSRSSIQVFMSSRPGDQIERCLKLEQASYSEIHTGQQGSFQDIELYLRTRIPKDDEEENSDDLTGRIAAKSNGNFLWVALMGAKLETAYSIEDRQAVFNQMPPEMDQFYTRIVTSIIEDPNFLLIECILKWTVCSPKPLSMEELRLVVKLDIDKTLTASTSQLEYMTGHMLFVDAESDVHISHQTMLHFLTQPKEGFYIDLAGAHCRLAELCLVILCGSNFAPPRIRRGGLNARATTSSPLCAYAAMHFSFHLASCSSPNEKLDCLLDTFFTSNLLTWIEMIANTGNILILQQTAQRLKAYTRKRSNDQPLNVGECRNIALMAEELYNIFASFHTNIVASPSSIHWLVPHLCPPTSLIRKLFAKATKGLEIAGDQELDWNDRLTCYLHSSDASSIACCDRYLAVGLESGDIMLYSSHMSHGARSTIKLRDGDKVRHLVFNRSSSLLISYSARKLMLWELSGLYSSPPECIWSIDIDFTPYSITFGLDEHTIVLTHPEYSAVFTFRVTNGSRDEPTLLRSAPDSESDDDEQTLVPWIPASGMRLDPSLKLAASSYRNSTVCIWDLDAVEEIGKFERIGLEGVWVTPETLDMIFNPIANLELLAIAYNDGDLVTCNPWTLEQKCLYYFRESISILATTSDGRILAGATNVGEIYLLSFDTLQPLYRLQSPEGYLRINGLTFSTNNLRLFDIRDQTCDEWEPFVLLPKTEFDDTSTKPDNAQDSHLQAASKKAHGLMWDRMITVIENAPECGSLFVGRRDGSIDICKNGNGSTVHNLKIHVKFFEIIHLEWNSEKGILLSLDGAYRCIVTRITGIGDTANFRTLCLLQYRDSAIIRQTFIDPTASMVFIRTDYQVKIVQVDGSRVKAESADTNYQWMKHPSSPIHIIALDQTRIYLFEWTSTCNLTPTHTFTLLYQEPFAEVAPSPWIASPNSSYLIRFAAASDKNPTTVVIMDVSKLMAATNEVIPTEMPADWLKIDLLLGCLKSRLFFLNTDGWICSISVKRTKIVVIYTRHFYIPFKWRSGTENVVNIVSKTVVAYGRWEQLYIFNGFLEFEETIKL